MKFFIVVIFAFWLVGCESRSIHSTYLTMKADIPWLQSYCSENAQAPVVSYKGTSAYINIYCDKTIEEINWLNLVGQKIRDRGWIDMNDSHRIFCNPKTGVNLLLIPKGANSFGDRGISMRFPDGYCSKYRPDPYQSLSSAEQQNQTPKDE